MPTSLSKSMIHLLLMPLLSGAHESPILHRREEGEGESSGSSEPSDKIVIIHGILMALGFVVLFPLGAAWMRFFHFKKLAWFHGGWQLLTYVIVLAGMGIGIYLAVEEENWDEVNGHPIIGLIVILALAVQAALGLSHHLKHRKTGRPTTLGLSHRWWGRIILILGAINGGLGMQLAHEDGTAIIVYCVLAVVFFAIWGISLIIDGRRASKTSGTMSGPGIADGVPRSDRTSKESGSRV